MIQNCVATNTRCRRKFDLILQHAAGSIVETAEQRQQEGGNDTGSLFERPGERPGAWSAGGSAPRGCRSTKRTADRCCVCAAAPQASAIHDSLKSLFAEARLPDKCECLLVQFCRLALLLLSQSPACPCSAESAHKPAQYVRRGIQRRRCTPTPMHIQTLLHPMLLTRPSQPFLLPGKHPLGPRGPRGALAGARCGHRGGSRCGQRHGARRPRVAAVPAVDVSARVGARARAARGLKGG